MLALSGVPLAPAAPSAGSAGMPPVLAAGDALWPGGAARILARDASLYVEGDPAQSWYRLLSGTMRVFRVLRDGRRHIGEIVLPGQIFGFESGPTHLHGAEAIEVASVVVYPLARIEQRMAQDPAARLAIRRLLMERLAAAQQRILLLGGLNATGRLAAFLLAMAGRGHRRPPLAAALPMSRVDIADYLGLTVETVSRIFTALRIRGAIRLLAANRVEILDPALLEAASGGIVAADDPDPPRCA